MFRELFEAAVSASPPAGLAPSNQVGHEMTLHNFIQSSLINIAWCSGIAQIEAAVVLLEYYYV